MSVRKPAESLNSSYTNRACAKHPERLATHYYGDKGQGFETFYCEKCSIMLASQGYNVIKITSINSSSSKKLSLPNKLQRASKQFSVISNRKHEISMFVQVLQSLGYQLERKMESTQEYLIKSQSQHGRLIEQANNFYKQIQQLIELQKFTTYNSILNKRVSDQAEVREFRSAVSSALQQISCMMNDIRQNMDAVENVDYSIYSTIMGGYQNKIEKAKQITKEQIDSKQIEKCVIVLPQIPKALTTLSDKISICLANKSNSATHNSSYVERFKPQRIITQEDICMSEQSESQEEGNQNLQRKINLNININQPPYFKQIPVVESERNLKQSAFSFEENPNNQKQVRLNSDDNSLDASKYLLMRGFEEGKLSKIEERVKQVCESRQSLGEYLNISQSRNNIAEDTETILIA